MNAAAHPVLMPATVLLLFAGSAVAVGIGIGACQVLRRYSPGAGMCLIAFAVAAFALQAVDNGRLMALLSLSQEYAAAGPLKAELFQGLYLLASTARRWAHYSYLLVAVSWICLFFGVMYRFKLVPRVLAAIGIVTSLSQIAGVTLRAMFGLPQQMWWAVPLAPAYAGLAVWLIVRGFDERPSAVHADGWRDTTAAHG